MNAATRLLVKQTWALLEPEAILPTTLPEGAGVMRISETRYKEIIEGSGNYVRSVSLEHNHLSMVIWEMPGSVILDKHDHPDSTETYFVIRGTLNLFVEISGKVNEYKLTPDSVPVVVPRGAWRWWFTEQGEQTEEMTLLVTAYRPALSVERAIQAVHGINARVK